ncbi:MAG: DUF1549 domain-containing protein [Planctomycetaceae bacterium]|nr:DUF1549 domain-containing protein [Planctomycetaceae bacterium]
MSSTASLLWRFVLVVIAGHAISFADDPPLHLLVDQRLAPVSGIDAPQCSDAEFLRRVSLDLIGMPPGPDEARTFINDTAPDKRERLIDRLLASVHYPRHMASALDLMLMERRANTHVSADEWQAWLVKSVRDNKPWNVLARELLSADGEDPATRPAARFMLDRAAESHLLTRDIGRVFFGRDLQCAQCHDHPNIEDYAQEDYYGLQAFVVRASLFQPDKNKPAVIAETATGEASFKSVFTDRAGMSGPRVPDGQELLSVSFIPGEQYKVAPAKNVRSIPQESRILKLADVVTANPTEAFNRNIANRLWAHMLGRGIVEPVDLHHSANPPSNPKLLSVLAESFAESDYNVKNFLREIALSETYQRSATIPATLPSLDDLNAQIEQLKADAGKSRDQSYEVEAETEKLVTAVDAAFADLQPLEEAIDKTGKAVTEAIKVRDAAKAKVDARQKAVANQQSIQQLLTEAHVNAKAAAEAIKDDKELAALTATILRKSEAAQAALEKLQAAEQAEAKSLADSESALVASQTTARDAISAATPAKERLRDLRNQLVAKRQLAADHREQAAIAESKSEYLSTLATYQQQSQRIGDLSRQIPELEQSLAASQAKVPELQTAMTMAVKQLEDAQAQFKQSQEELAQATTQLNDTQETHGILQASLTKLDEARTRLSQEEELQLAHDRIAAKLSQLASDIKAMQETVTKNQQQQVEAQKLVMTREAEHKASQQKVAEQEKAVAGLEAQVKSQTNQLAETHTKAAESWGQIVASSATLGNTAQIAALTPEQLGWSVLIATGQHQRQLATQESKLNKEKPLSDEDKQDPNKVAARATEITEAATAASQKSVENFVTLFGAGSGQPQGDFFATAEQALFFANGSELSSWLSPASGNLTDRLRQLEDPAAIADELYVSVLCRNPTPDEIQEIQSYLAERHDAKDQAVQELAWALITSAEFRFQY